MGKHDHASCEHEVAWCRHCDVAYCQNCDITWTRRPVHGTTYPWYGQVNAFQAADTTASPPPGLGVPLAPPYGADIPPPYGLTGQFAHAHGGAGDGGG